MLVIDGSNILKQMLICRVIVYQLWSGLPVANANSNVEKEENEKKVEAQGVMEDEGQGEVGHGDDGLEDDGQEADDGLGDVGHLGERGDKVEKEVEICDVLFLYLVSCCKKIKVAPNSCFYLPEFLFLLQGTK